jgi:hypothetical protein
MVNDLIRGDLERLYAQLRQFIHRLQVEWGGKKVDSALDGVIAQLALPVPRQLNPLDQREGRFAGGRSVAIIHFAEARRETGVQRLSAIGLKLDGIGPAISRHVNELVSNMQITIVVGAGFRDDVGGSAGPHDTIPDLDRGG